MCWYKNVLSGLLRRWTFDVGHWAACLFFLLFTSPIFAQNSVLAEGKFFKIGVTKTSVYRLNATFFRELGVNIAEINPRNLRLFGNGGGMLPQSNNASRPTNLTENAIWVKGEADGRFDESDAVLFFGQSPHEIIYNAAEKRLEHQLNAYSDTTFYFLQLGNVPGLRLQNQQAGKSGAMLNTYDDYVFRETEAVNKIQSGREWWGEYFGSQVQQELIFEIQGVVGNAPFLLRAATVAAAQVNTKFSVLLNGQPVGSQSMATVSTYRYDLKGQRTLQNYAGTLAPETNRLRVGLTFDKAGQTSAEGYLDFVGVQFKRSLRRYDQPTIIQNLSSLGQDSVQYVVDQASAVLQIWDITDGLRPRNQLFRLNGAEATFGTDAKILRRFVLFAENQLQTPVVAAAMPNQNLRAAPTPELLIVTSGAWLAQAQRLANFRQTHDKLTTLVVTTAQVYNEFASGQPDPVAIRDFAKYLNDRQPNRLKYLLLFGDATYDFKNNSQLQDPSQMANLVPTYQSRESAQPVFSYSSDDFFGFLKPSDGVWNEDFSGNHLLDIGVGRLPAKTPDEARTMIDKLIRYTQKSASGRWQQRVTFVADDGDGNIHQQDADDLAALIGRTATAYDISKIYVDAFPQVVSSTLQRAPEVNRHIDQSVENGTLILNYTGHGGASIWAEEQILTLQDLLGWRNFNNMPLLVTATCEFGRFDDPNVVSGAELAVLSPRGGAIAALTTTRPVFANTNFLLNQAFYGSVFQSVDGQMPRLGDVMRLTKNNSLSGVLNRNFTLLGDPSMRLNYPENQVKITTNDTLKAGKLVTIKGEIRRQNQLLNNFNGTATVSVFDKETQFATKGTESSPMRYGQFDSKLFEGKATVQNGRFAVQFVVPKNIDYRLGKGRVSVHAMSADSLVNAAGGSNQVLVGGSDVLVADNKPPVMTLFLNNEDFKNGGEVNENPLFIAKISDENGLNLSRAGIGQDMRLTLNDTLALTMNDYFTANQDDFRAGVILFPFQQLPAGNHKLKLKVWDTYNNATEGTLDFRVLPSGKVLKNWVVFPNPFSDIATVQLSPMKEGDDLEMSMQIFDLSGKLVKAEKYDSYNTDNDWKAATWQGTDQYNQKVATGVYSLRLTVRSLVTQKVQIVLSKLLYVP
jgi:Peptidase family C25